jgi:glycosyltransferase involved in cell wall biosynthesis
MRVLMTGDTVGGVLTYSCELANALAEQGVETTLALMGPPRDVDCAARVEQREYALEWMDEPWDDVERAGTWLRELADDVQPDVVHLNGYAHAVLDWDAPVVVVGHSCVLSWHEAVRGEPAPRSWERYRRAVTDGLRAAELVVAPTTAMLRELVRLYGVCGPTMVIPNGRNAYDVQRAKEPFVLAAGRFWDDAKNLRALDRAAAAVDWPVLVAGDEPAEKPQNVQLLGRLSDDELADLMARASIFAAPALYEPFGLAPLEAALSGCALVLGDIPSLHEVWDDAAVYARDCELAAALRSLIRDRDHRERLADAAQARAAQYTPERMASAYVDAYEQVSA